jgi:ribosomal protein S18 acetylase RimI-like enzyme
MRIEKIEENKKRFLDLLLLADEQETMIDRYLSKGDMFALFDDGLKSVCVVTNEGDGICELKNIATYEVFQGRGYGKKLLNYIMEYYRDRYKVMYVGTGDNAEVVSFYEHFGFTYSHRIPNFFIDYYDKPIFEDERQLVDMVYFKKEL